jgi:hypothetical protein
MLFSGDDYKRLSVRKSKYLAYMSQVDREKFIADFKAAQPVLSKKQKKNRARNDQLELPLDVSPLFYSDPMPRKKRTR